MYRSLTEYRLTASALALLERQRTRNAFPMTLGLYGSGFNDVLKALAKRFQMLENGLFCTPTTVFPSFFFLQHTIFIFLSSCKVSGLLIIPACKPSVRTLFPNSLFSHSSHRLFSILHPSLFFPPTHPFYLPYIVPGLRFRPPLHASTPSLSPDHHHHLSSFIIFISCATFPAIAVSFPAFAINGNVMMIWTFIIAFTGDMKSQQKRPGS